MPTGTPANDVLYGTDDAELFDVTQGGNDKCYGGGGDDNFYFGLAFTAKDRVVGGDGFDYVLIDGANQNLLFTHKQINGIESIDVSGGHSSLAVDDTVIGHGETLYVNFSNATAIFDGHLELNGRLVVTAVGSSTVHFVAGGGDDSLSIDLLGTDNYLDGGAGDDLLAFNGSPIGVTADLRSGTIDGITATLVSIESLQGWIYDDTLYGNGGANQLYGLSGHDVLYGFAGADVFSGGMGADTMYGGKGADTFTYFSASYSTGTTHDIIGGFNGNADSFKVSAAVTGVDPTIIGGTVTAASFDADLASAVSGKISASHAVVVQPDGGDYAGTNILVVDLNGSAAYESGSDLVIELPNAHQLDALSAASFQVF